MRHKSTPHPQEPAHLPQPAHAYIPPHGESLDLPQLEVMECGAAISGNSMDRFVTAFERAARRWEMVVYPAMFAFVLLAAYGFFLVYNLSQDMHLVATRFDPNMGEHMEALANNISDLNQNISLMAQHMDTISTSVADMSHKLDTLDPMLTRLADMEKSMRVMTGGVDQMRQDMSAMNQNFGRPMNLMNRVAPW